ncbi:MAG: tetratricopeptide repeat protein [Caldimonas sp.]
MPLALPRSLYWRQKLLAMAWLVLGRKGRAAGVLDALLSRWPGDAWGLASRAHLRAQLGDRQAALTDAERLVAEHPQRSAADWFNLGYLREALDQGDVEAAFRQAVTLDPRLDRAWYGLALALIRVGRLDEAKVALKRNTELQPMSPYGWYQLARVHVDRRETEQAVRIIAHLKGFEPKVAAQLERETGLSA